MYRMNITVWFFSYSILAITNCDSNSGITFEPAAYLHGSFCHFLGSIHQVIWGFRFLGEIYIGDV